MLGEANLTLQGDKDIWVQMPRLLQDITEKWALSLQGSGDRNNLLDLFEEFIEGMYLLWDLMPSATLTYGQEISALALSTSCRVHHSH